MNLQNNDKITIRDVRFADAAAVLSLQREVVGEGEFFIAVAAEYNKTIEEQRDQICSIIENERETMYVADIDGQIVGLIVLSSQNRKRLSHTGSISMMIKKEYRNMGVGKLLLLKLLAWTEQHPLLEKVCLGVFSTNHRAIALYKKMGFVEEGRKVREFKLGDNEYVDDILMYKFV